MRISTRAALIVGALLLVAIYLLAVWYRPVAPISTAVYAPAATAPAVAAVPTVAVPVQAVRVIPKAAAKKLKLPTDVVADQRQQILAAVEVPPTQGGATAVTVIDTDTGAARTIVREKRRPLLALATATEVGARYGLASDGIGQRIDLYARRDLLRIGAVHLAAYAEVNTRPEIMGMLDVSVRW